jgi:lipid-A-disaccharide synthase-like uncharacterized protein
MAPEPRRRRIKWEPWGLMALLLGLGLWLVYAPGQSMPTREGAWTAALRLGQTRGVVEVYRVPGGEPEFRILLRDGHASAPMGRDEFASLFGERAAREALEATSNWVFRLLNITSWWSLVWVGIGFGGQAAFAGRTLVQWLVSESRKESVVPEAFWWMSLFGGVALFAYFAWRQDPVGVLGQCTGVVIYARNLRLIYKQRRQEISASAPNSGITPG